MKALEIFRKQQELAKKHQFVPTVPTEKKQVGTAQATNTGGVPSVPTVPTKKNKLESENKIKIFNYRIKDKPNSLLTAIMPGTELSEAWQILREKYRDRLLMVTEK